MRTLVLGDVHGAHRALEQVLARAGFSPRDDRLVFLGDVCDGWPDTPLCIDYLLGCSNLVHLMGNHDLWTDKWIRGKVAQPIWLDQGGRATLESYGGRPDGVPESHVEYLKSARYWFVEDGRAFVHGGFMTPHPEQSDRDELVWDRHMWNYAILAHRAGAWGPQQHIWAEVYVGHTTTTPLRPAKEGPVYRAGVWNLDQGAGWEGRLSVMDVDTKEWWQSDPVADLYPNYTGRR